MNFELIVAFNNKNIIGINNKIPWYVPEDLKYFKNQTKDHIIVMGRKTFESLPNGPLKNRIHVILTNQELKNSEDVFFTSFEQSFDLLVHLQSITNKKVFIIGGNTIYKQYFEYCTKFHITVIDDDQDGDVSFPYTLEYFVDNFKKIEEKDFISVKNLYFKRLLFERF